jgi:tRNA (cmo5U34)-methyltransferase
MTRCRRGSGGIRMTVSSAAAWRETDSAEFIESGAFFVPEREVQMRILAELVPPAGPGSHIIDLCCGEGLLARELLTRNPLAVVHGYDGSPAMLEHAVARLGQFGERFRPQPFDIKAADWRSFPHKVHAFVSSLAVHHLDAGEKLALFDTFAGALMPGGVVVIADLVLPETELGRGVAAREWDEAVRQRSLRLRGDLAAFERFQSLKWNYFRYPDPLDKPSTLTDQLGWLEAAGFENIDLHWMRAGHAIFSGALPS